MYPPPLAHFLVPLQSRGIERRQHRRGPCCPRRSGWPMLLLPEAISARRRNRSSRRSAALQLLEQCFGVGEAGTRVDAHLRNNAQHTASTVVRHACVLRKKPKFLSKTGPRATNTRAHLSLPLLPPPNQSRPVAARKAKRTNMEKRTMSRRRGETGADGDDYAGGGCDGGHARRHRQRTSPKYVTRFKRWTENGRDI